MAIKWCQHHAVDILSDEPFHHLSLLFTIVLPQRPFPYNGDLVSASSLILRCLDGTSMNTFPIFVGRSLWNYGNGVGICLGSSLAACNESERKNKKTGKYGIHPAPTNVQPQDHVPPLRKAPG